jgi:hypothetical protein
MLKAPKTKSLKLQYLILFKNLELDPDPDSNSIRIQIQTMTAGPHPDPLTNSFRSSSLLVIRVQSSPESDPRPRKNLGQEKKNLTGLQQNFQIFSQ